MQSVFIWRKLHHLGQINRIPSVPRTMRYHCCSLIGALCVDPVIDWSVCVSVRLQLHLSPGVWRAGPAGLQPERQQPTGKDISQKTLLHASSVQGKLDMELNQLGAYCVVGVVVGHELFDRLLLVLLDVKDLN